MAARTVKREGYCPERDRLVRCAVTEKGFFSLRPREARAWGLAQPQGEETAQ